MCTSSSPHLSLSHLSLSFHKAEEEVTSIGSTVIAQLVTVDGVNVGPQLEIPLSATPAQLSQLVNRLQQNTDVQPFAFYVDDAAAATAAAAAAAAADGDTVVPPPSTSTSSEVTSNVETVVREQSLSTEVVLRIRCEPLAMFKVRPISRCTDTLPGHAGAILHLRFSPGGERIVSGGGDNVVRFWDTATATPRGVCAGHRHHVLAVAWSPDGGECYISMYRMTVNLTNIIIILIRILSSQRSSRPVTRAARSVSGRRAAAAREKRS